jgi:predicted nucleotidyltransferase
MIKLEDATTLSATDRELLLSVRQIVHRFVPTATLLLYGSAARGAQDPESDYDVLIVTDAGLSKGDELTVRNAVYDLELTRNVVISVLFYAKDEWNGPVRRVSPFHVNVERDAIVI